VKEKNPMDNPNNSWVYYPPPEYPPPPGYPPPPAPRGLLAPPKGTKRGLALVLLCAMALVQLAATLLPYLAISDFIDVWAANPLHLAMDGANLLLVFLVLLKFLLPGWEPHRKTLAWLLGVTLLAGMGSYVYGLFQGFAIGVEEAGGAMEGPLMTGMRIGAVFVTLFITAIRPQFWLLIGIWAKKSMEKLAGLITFISMGGSLLLTLVGILLTMLGGEAKIPDILWTVTVPGLASSLCWAIFCFTWPVLDRPVLEKAA